MGTYYMDKNLKTKLTNHLRHEAEYTMKYEDNINLKLNKMDTIFNLQKILDNYEDLEPILRNYFNKKAQEDKWNRIHKNEIEK